MRSWCIEPQVITVSPLFIGEDTRISTTSFISQVRGSVPIDSAVRWTNGMDTVESSRESQLSDQESSVCL
jgi:hypothetical protein